MKTGFEPATGEPATAFEAASQPTRHFTKMAENVGIEPTHPEGWTRFQRAALPLRQFSRENELHHITTRYPPLHACVFQHSLSGLSLVRV